MPSEVFRTQLCRDGDLVEVDVEIDWEPYRPAITDGPSDRWAPAEGGIWVNDTWNVNAGNGLIISREEESALCEQFDLELRDRRETARESRIEWILEERRQGREEFDE